MEGIKVERLTIGYQEPILESLSFYMAEGEFWIIVGPNGVGKSTLIKTLLGIIPPISGKIYIHGSDCTYQCEERKFLSYVPQMEDYSRLFPATALDVVLSGLFPVLGRFSGLKEKDVRRAVYWMEQLGIGDIKNKQFNTLSGGQQRKVLIARALVGDPHYVFLDEPMTGVDLKSSRRILRIINDLHKERGFGICMVTHDLNFVWNYADKIILIGYDRVFIGNKEDVLDRDLLSSIYQIDVKVSFTEHGPMFLVGDKHI